MEANDWAVRCEGLAYRYPNGFSATRGVDLTVRRGELYCLLGPNGAGKTTLIRQLTGSLTPTEGRVTIFGKEPGRASGAARRRMGIIPQHVGLFDALTVREHLFHIGALKGLSGGDLAKSIAKVVAASQIDDLLPKRARTLSGGQQRSVLFALALLGDPDLLILDEPTVGLDPVARRVIWNAIDAQKAAGKAVLLTTHYMDEAETLATRLGFYAQGRITHEGTVEELRAGLGKTVRLLAEHDDGKPRVYWTDTVEEAQTLARRERLSSFSIGKASLEDLYLRLARGGGDAVGAAETDCAA